MLGTPMPNMDPHEGPWSPRSGDSFEGNRPHQSQEAPRLALILEASDMFSI